MLGRLCITLLEMSATEVHPLNGGFSWLPNQAPQASRNGGAVANLVLPWSGCNAVGWLARAGTATWLGAGLFDCSLLITLRWLEHGR